MKTTWILTSLFLSSAALAVGTNATTMDQETTESTSSSYYGSNTNTNDRYNNLDERTNSMSTPGHYGAESNTLGEPENPSRMTGGSTENSTLDWEQQAGNPTTEWEKSQNGARSSTNRTTGGSDYRRDHMRSPSDSSYQHRDMRRNEVAPTTTATPSTSSSSTMDSTTVETNRTTGSSADAAAAGAAGATTGAAAGTAAHDGMTAQDTARAESDTELVRKIRSEITSNSDLSVRAHNVKIINQNGQIYLKGPVANTMEKSKVESIAKRMAGNMNVVNQTYVEKK